MFMTAGLNSFFLWSDDIYDPSLNAGFGFLVAQQYGLKAK